MYSKYIKRLIDLVLSLTGLIVLGPLLILLIISLSIYYKGNPFFLQSRPGMNERIFRVIKFKTMNDKRNNKGELISDSLRLTSLGKFIRKTSLDELPQLVNVIKGDMSIIGPRPLLVKYLNLYNERQRQRHMVKPGITGWAQVNGRNAIKWKDKFEYDVWYVEKISFALDIKILILTMKKVFKSEGINQAGQATSEAFNGNN